jgi:hypothetical protein
MEARAFDDFGNVGGRGSRICGWVGRRIGRIDGAGRADRGGEAANKRRREFTEEKKEISQAWVVKELAEIYFIAETFKIADAYVIAEAGIAEAIPIAGSHFVEAITTAIQIPARKQRGRRSTPHQLAARRYGGKWHRVDRVDNTFVSVHRPTFHDIARTTWR